MALIAILIKLLSRGPVLFRQPRIGHGGKVFVCLKFRTVVEDANPADHAQYLKGLMESPAPLSKPKLRLIPLGPFLRASGLDELPQLFNVLRGEMSLVGPRPCTPEEFEQYKPWQKGRVAVLPGLTGLWQVNGKNKTSFRKMIRLDLRYIERCSLWEDIKILFKTLPAVWAELAELRARRQAQCPADRSKRARVLGAPAEAGGASAGRWGSVWLPGPAAFRPPDLLSLSSPSVLLPKAGGAEQTSSQPLRERD